MKNNDYPSMKDIIPFAIYRATTLPRAKGCLGDIGNIVSMMALSSLGIGIWFAGLKPWGGVQGATIWAGLIIFFLLILWFVLSRFSGWLNAIVMIAICWSGFAGSDGIVNHTEGFSTVAAYIRQPSSNGNTVLHNLGGIQAYNSDNDVEITDDYQKVLEDAWTNYSPDHPWYTQERFNEAWKKFESAPSKNTEIPFLYGDDFDTDAEGFSYSPLDHHRDR